MLEFNIGTYPIRVHFTFLLLAVIVVNSGFGAAGLIIWTVVAFLSILLHELGHAYMEKRQGARLDHIMIYAMGGLTLWHETQSDDLKWRDRIVIAAAGPMTGIVIGLIVFGLIRIGALGDIPQQIITQPWQPYLVLWALEGEWLVFTAGVILWVSLIFGIFNLLPIGGLDGSHILSAFLEHLMPTRGRQIAAVIGIATAVAVAVWSYNAGFTFLPFIVLLFAAQDFGRVMGRAR